MKRQLLKGNGNRGRSEWLSPYLRQELDEMFNRMWGGEGGWLGTETLTPTMDLSETEDAYRATLDLPGVEPEDIDVQVSGNVLTIAGHRQEEQEEKGRTFHRVERSSGGFARSVTLPCDVDEERVAANFDGGVLTVELPKAMEAKPRRVQVKK